MLGRPILGVGRIHHVLSGTARGRILETAFDAGITAFDTAPCYGEGLAERELGRFLQGRRRQCQVYSKFGIPFVPIGDLPSSFFFFLRAVSMITRLPLGANYRIRDFSLPTLRKSVTASLRRLRTTYIDCLFIHEPLVLTAPTDLGELFAGLESLVKEGLIREYGLTLGPERMWRGLHPTTFPSRLVIMAPVCDSVMEWCKHPALASRTVAYDLVTYLATQRGVAPTPEEVVAFWRASLPGASPIVASRQVARIAAYGRAFAETAKTVPFQEPS